MIADDTELVNYLVRMVTPLRREFGRTLDVGQFRLDAGYANEVLDLARTSLDPRLREYGSHVEQRLSGSRGTGSAAMAQGQSPVPPTPSPVLVATAGAAPPPAESAAAVDKAAEESLRARVMKKYTSGLR